MRKIITKIVLTSLFLIQAYAFQGFAQAPSQFSYQAVIRDANGMPYPYRNQICPNPIGNFLFTS
jgi:hypothetical protein